MTGPTRGIVVVTDVFIEFDMRIIKTTTTTGEVEREKDIRQRKEKQMMTTSLLMGLHA